MAKLVLLPIDRLKLLAVPLAAAAIATGVPHEAFGQQSDQPHRQQAPPKPKPHRVPSGPAKAPAAKAEAPPAAPSQVGIPTVAREAFMVDPQTSTVLLYKDADTPMAPSSMAKMMTVHIVFEDLASGHIKLDTQFRVSERARNMGGSRMFVELGSDVTVEELLKGMITLSGNDACVVIAEGMAGSEENFVERMNRRAKELGMNKTVFKNSSGWPAEGQYSTARDLALLAWRTIHDFPQYYHYYAETNWTYHNIKQDNRNRLLKSTAGVDGLKTGHTEEGGFGQATSAIRDGRRLILVLNGMTSMAERAQESARLIEWGYRESTNTTIFRAGDVVAEAPVWMGVQEKLPLVIPMPVQVTTLAGQSAQPRVVARFEGPIPAPIAKGSRLGTAAVTVPDGRVLEYPLEAGADIPRKGIVGRISTLIQYYLFGWLS